MGVKGTTRSTGRSNSRCLAPRVAMGYNGETKVGGMLSSEDRRAQEIRRFADAVRAILAEADRDPDLVKQAPHLAPRRRLDEVRAARQPVLRWTPRNPG